MLVFTAITPHSPLLVPSIGKENLKKLSKTASALEKLEEDFYHAQIDTVVIISPHADTFAGAFVISFSPKFMGQFKEFGDFSTKKEYFGDNELSYKIKESLEATTPLQLHTNEQLDYGSLVPLHFLTSHQPQIKVIPISCSGLSYKAHFEFGQFLVKTLIHSPKRVAIIASADLSHKLSKKSPSGYSLKAKKFDQELIEDLQKKSINKIIKLKYKEADDLGACGIKSILILLGALADINYKPELLSYEGPFGVGYLVMKMGL